MSCKPDWETRSSTSGVIKIENTLFFEVARIKEIMHRMLFLSSLILYTSTGIWDIPAHSSGYLPTEVESTTPKAKIVYLSKGNYDGSFRKLHTVNSYSYQYFPNQKEKNNIVLNWKKYQVWLEMKNGSFQLVPSVNYPKWGQNCG